MQQGLTPVATVSLSLSRPSVRRAGDGGAAAQGSIAGLLSVSQWFLRCSCRPCRLPVSSSPEGGRSRRTPTRSPSAFSSPVRPCLFVFYSPRAPAPPSARCPDRAPTRYVRPFSSAVSPCVHPGPILGPPPLHPSLSPFSPFPFPCKVGI